MSIQMLPTLKSFPDTPPQEAMHIWNIVSHKYLLNKLMYSLINIPLVIVTIIHIDNWKAKCLVENKYNAEKVVKYFEY